MKTLVILVVLSIVTAIVTLALDRPAAAQTLPLTVGDDAYTMANGTLDYALSIGSPWSGDVANITVPYNKVYFPFVMDLRNRGQGKLFGAVIRLRADSPIQDRESIRGLVLQLTQEGGAGSAEKTTGARFDVAATDPTYDGLLWGASAGVTASAGLGNNGGLFSAAFVAGNSGADDKASGFLLGPGADQARQVIGFGNLQPVPYLLAAFRAVMDRDGPGHAFLVTDDQWRDTAWITALGQGIFGGAHLINRASDGARTGLILNGDGNRSYIGFVAPPNAPNVIYTLPSTPGNPGDVLTTDGAGTLRWSAR